MRFMLHAHTAALALSAALAHAAGPTGLLNDTGQSLCYDAGDAAVACSSAGVGSDGGNNPRQDARFGRDAAQAAGVLPAKIGGGAAGFDFTKVCLNGDLAGQGSCASDPTTGDANPWACTKDNITNLIWSIESLPSTWAQATDTAAGSLSAAYNTAVHCGFSAGWRAPSTHELLSIVHNNAVSPATDTYYFPGTASSRYWTADTYVPPPGGAWFVDFNDGSANAFTQTNTYLVRLVRSGQ